MGQLRSSIVLAASFVCGCDCGGGEALDRVNGKLEVSPPVIDFGAAHVGSERTETVTLSNTGLVEVEIGSVKLRDFASFQIARALESKTLAAGEEGTIEVSYVPGNEGAHQSELIVEANDLEETHTVELRGSATIVRGQCALEVTPSSLDFSARDDQTLTARNVSTEACEISRSALNGAAASAFTFVGTLPIAIPSGGATLLHVLFYPGAGASGEAELVLSTNDVDAPDKHVTLIAPEADKRLCVDPRMIHFARATGASTQPVMLTACGVSEVNVSALDFTMASMEISIANAPAMPMLIPAGQSRMISIQYRPENQDEDHAILTVRSDDSAAPAIDVDITGSPDIVPPDAGRYLYYWRVAGFDTSDIMRVPLQMNGSATAFWGQSTNQGCPGCHQVSPDGRYIAMVEFGFTSESLFVVDTMSGTKLNLDQTSRTAKTFSWRPNVNTNPPYQYVFSANGRLQTASLMGGYIGELNGANDPQLAQAMPAWGPNGKIAFVRGSPDAVFDGFGFTGAADLYLVDENGGTASAVTGASNDNKAHYYPSFSPNGMWIAYTESASADTTYAAADAQVRIVKSDQSGTVKSLSTINGGGGATSFPTWSLDGTYLGFSSNRTGGMGDWDVYVAPIDPVSGVDGAPTNVANANSAGFEHGAQWSP